MASTYVNDLRLNEMATGDASGSWGTITNTNLELIGEAFGYGTETIGNADTTITMADGASDAARSFYLKITSSADLTTTRVITLAPNTVSKVWIIENATTGSQIITIKQGTGATINIANGHVKMVATDGAGSGGAVLDLLTDLNVATNLFVKNAGTGDGSTANIYLQTAEADIAADDVIGKINFQAPNEGTGTDAILVSAAIQAISEGDFSSSSNATSLNFMTGASEAATTKMTLSSAGNLTVTGIVDVTDTTDASDATGDTGALRTEGGASIAKKLYVGTDLDVDGTTNLDVVDIDGAVDMASTLQVDGAITSSAGATITTADNNTQLTLKSTDADASAGPRFDLTRDSASPADGDNIGRIRYLFDNDAGEQTEGIRIDGVLQDVSDGTEDVAYVIDTIIGGTLRERVGYRAAETVFNEDSVDLDFRVESNGGSHALFVDGGANHVNIMTSTDLGAVLNVSGNAYIQHADNSDTLTLETTDADANAGPNLLLYRNSSSPADADRLGTLTFRGRNDNSQDVEYIVFDTFINDVSDGTEDASMDIRIMTGGAESSRVNFDRTATVFNEAGSGGVDFRVESGNNANMLVVNAGDDQVIIGGDTQKTTDWQSDARGLTVVGVKPTIALHDQDNANYVSFISQVSGDQYIYNRGGGKVYFGISETPGSTSATYMTVADYGAVTKPLQPAFLVTPNAEQTDIANSGIVTVVLDSEVYDTGANFASNTFTAPVTGKYQLSANVYMGAIDTAPTYYEASIRTSNRNYHHIIAPKFASDLDYMSLNVTVLADMDNGDTAYVTIVQAGGTSQTDIFTSSFFSGFLAC